MKRDKLTKVLNQPDYWVEGINGLLYNSIMEYMEQNKLNRTEMAKELGITKGRLSQILNSGETNFSIEKLVAISIKIGKYPVLTLEAQNSYINKLIEQKNSKKIRLENLNEYVYPIGSEAKIIHLSAHNQTSLNFAI